jgi:hypothetical protein
VVLPMPKVIRNNKEKLLSILVVPDLSFHNNGAELRVKNFV